MYHDERDCRGFYADFWRMTQGRGPGVVEYGVQGSSGLDGLKSTGGESVLARPRRLVA